MADLARHRHTGPARRRPPLRLALERTQGAAGDPATAIEATAIEFSVLDTACQGHDANPVIALQPTRARWGDPVAPLALPAPVVSYPFLSRDSESATRLRSYMVTPFTARRAWIHNATARHRNRYHNLGSLRALPAKCAGRVPTAQVTIVLAYPPDVGHARYLRHRNAYKKTARIGTFTCLSRATVLGGRPAAPLSRPGAMNRAPDILVLRSMDTRSRASRRHTGLAPMAAGRHKCRAFLSQSSIGTGALRSPPYPSSTVELIEGQPSPARRRKQSGIGRRR